MKLFIPITKIDEEKREVWGTATQEVLDRENEIFDYDSSKPFFEKWSKYFDDATAGKSLGNLRAMHNPVSAGKLTAIAFDDAEKRIDVVAKVVDDAEWNKCLEGVYTGFSVGGRVVRKWRDPKNGNAKRYTADPVETSLADFPAVPTAVFSLVKIGGSVEKRSFRKSPTSDVEYADPSAKRLPLNTLSRVRFALAAWGFEKVRSAYDAKEQVVISRKIRQAARKHDIEVTEKAMLAGDFAKGLYEVARFADIVSAAASLQRSIRWEDEYEADEDSQVPDKLRDLVGELGELLEEMTGEEVDELMESLGVQNEFATSTSKTATSGSTPMKTTDAAGATISAADAEVFAKVAKKHIAKLGEVIEHAKALHKMFGDHCEKLDDFHAEIGGAAKGENAKGEEGEDGQGKKGKKIADAGSGGADNDRFAKIEGQIKTLNERVEAAEKERDEARTVAADAVEMVSKLTGGDHRPALRVVEKAEDTGAGGTTQKTITVEAPKTARDAFKRAFLNPQVEALIPEKQTA